ncbi:DNA-dependent metalloprotease SPRTN-like [Anopheles nili]|uniref:DNA-dependent metalloprotease SPRTN-like n=1 Tax=Anopheles nili TaxID=185578 RepID=UPI00237BE16F|nr:DNA-dependent metalloprotease SPRTN-like [Anopheles nili]
MGKDHDLNCTQNIVHPEWEILDPTPDIYALFPLFDRKFFQERLSCVQLEWSKKMYNCAGICYQRSNRLGKSCIIRLSEPLLKLRTRKNLIETLLHEMIHAYCFVLGIREGNGGHGPTFKKIMNGINKIAGTNITVYHTFHDEVNLYKTHWWKCNGPCQHKPPFYGVVKRTSNRKPGTYDFWWQEHQRTCGGEFIKVKEPSPKRKLPRSKNKENVMGSQSSNQERSQDSKKTTSTKQQKNVISNYFNNSSSENEGTAVLPTARTVPPKNKTYTPAAKPNFGGGTLVIQKPPAAKASAVTPKSEIPTAPAHSLLRGNLPNVKQLRDLASDEHNCPTQPLFSGRAFVLGSGSSGNSGERRSRLLDKFPDTSSRPSASKKRRVEQLPSTSSNRELEAVMLSDDSDYIFDEIDLKEVEKTVANIKKERQDAIKKEIIESSLNEENDEIFLIDDDFDDELADEELSSIDDSILDRSVIDDLFNDRDDLMDDFNRTNARITIENSDDEIVSCPICLQKMSRAKSSDHFEVCFAQTETKTSGTSVQLVASSDLSQPSTSKGTPVSKKKTAASDVVTAQQQLLRSCGYGEDEISKVLEDTTSQDIAAPNMATLKQNVLRECGYTETDIIRALDDGSDDDDVQLVSIDDYCSCPICSKVVSMSSINQHLDQCVTK